MTRFCRALSLGLLTLLASSACRHTRPARYCMPSSRPRSAVAVQLGGYITEIRGRVVYLSTGAPVSDAAVILTPGGHYVSSDSTGFFRFANIPQGAYEIQVRRLGLQPARDTVTFGGDGLDLLAALANPSVGLRECAPFRG